MPPPVTVADLPLWFVRVFAFVWGAVWGSFANVVIYRWPRELSLTHPPSRCPHCETPIKPYDNVPILGWLWLGGKCRACKAPISARYPFVEALYATVALVVSERILRMDVAPMLSVGVCLFLVRFAFAWGLLTVAFVDMETFLIPDFISIGGTVLGLAAAFVLPGGGWRAALSGAGLGFGVLYGLHFFWSRFLKREGMGLGDAKLLAMIGAFTGPAGVMFALVAGSVQGLVATVVSRITGWRIGPDPSLLDDDVDGGEASEDPLSTSVEPKDATQDTASPDAKDDPGLLRTAIPFGPFLVLGALEYFLGLDTYVQRIYESLTAP